MDLGTPGNVKPLFYQCECGEWILLDQLAMHLLEVHCLPLSCRDLFRDPAKKPEADPFKKLKEAK